MKNYVKSGDVLTLTAPTGGVVSGTAYLIGTMLVIATTTAAATEVFEGRTVGVYDVPKVSAQAWTVGARIYWDDTAKLFTTVLTSNTLVGVAALAAANPSSTGRVRLNGSF
jgi:predicted RecA/RadA family phage recombinase